MSKLHFLLVKGVWSELKSKLGRFYFKIKFIQAKNEKNIIFEVKYCFKCILAVMLI